MHDTRPHIALADEDISRYQLGAVLDKGNTLTIGGVVINVPQTNRAAHKLTQEHLEGILEATGCTELRCFLSEGRNFRFARATIQPYKGNRIGKDKPYHYNTIGNYIKDTYNPIICTEFEADDVICSHQDIEGGTTVICSRDKDLRIKGGWHYSWAAGKDRPEKPLYWIEPFEGLRWFYTQCLTGDAIDAIIGCGKKLPTKTGTLRRKGVGAKTAEKLLQGMSTEQELFKTVAGQYRLVYGEDWKPALLENGTLLYMCDELITWENLDSTKRLFKEYENNG